MAMSVKLSNFLLIEQNEQRAWILNSLTRGVMTCSPLVATKVAVLPMKIHIDELLNEFGNDFVIALVRLGAIVSATTDEMEVLRHQVKTAINDQTTVGFVIAPTLSCNCDCHYCFEKDVRHTSDNLSAQDIISFIKTKAEGKESLTIQWFGGEPLQSIDLLECVSKEISRYCNEAGMSFAFNLVTNGVLLTNSVAERLDGCNVRKVQVTLEGNKSLHDKIRVTKNRGATFSSIIENINHCGNILDISIRVHVAPYNIESVEQLINELGEIGLGRKIKEIYFSPLFDFKRSFGGGVFIHDDKKFLKMESFAQVEAKLYRLAAEARLPLPKLFDEGFDICTAVRNNTYVLDPTGNIHRCYFHLGDSRKSYGTVDDGITEIANLKEWLDIQVPRDEECANCKLLPVCLGGCSVKWMNGSSKEVICDSLRYNLRQMLPIFYPVEPDASLTLRSSGTGAIAPAP